MKHNKNLAIGLGLGATFSLMGLVALNILKKGVKAVEPELAAQASKKIFKQPCKVLALSPHPDDLDFFAGGTLRLLADRGFDITVVDVTDGEKGVNIPNLGSIRQHEQKKAQKILGYQNLIFLHYPDMKISYKRLTKDLRNIWYDVNPEIVFTFDHNFPLKFLAHNDHLAVGKAVCNLATEMDSPAKVYLYGSRKNNILVDISEVIADKTEAVLSHKSQLRFSKSLYSTTIKKMGNYAASGSNLKQAEAFRAFHNFDSFPKGN